MIARLDWGALLDAIHRQMRRWLHTRLAHEGCPWRLCAEKYERVLHKLESRHALLLAIGQPTALVEALVEEDRQQQARIISGALRYLHTAVTERPEVEQPLRAAIDRIKPRLEPCAPAG